MVLHLLLQIALKTVIVFLLEMDGELRLLAEHAPGDAVQVRNSHLTHRLLLVKVKYLIFGDDEGARLRPVVLVNFRYLVAKN